MSLQSRLQSAPTRRPARDPRGGPARLLGSARRARRLGRSVRRAQDADPPRHHHAHRPAPLQRHERRPRALRARGRGGGRGARARQDAADAAGARPGHPRDHGRHPRLRPAGALPARRHHHRGDGQQLRTRSSSSAAARSRRTNAQFADDQHLLRIIDKIISRIGRRVDEASPMVDARLPDGSRVNAIIPPLAVRGPALTIRKFRKDPFHDGGPARASARSRRSAASSSRRACAASSTSSISGGTGSGKTTTLNVLSAAIPNDERIITVEDAAELQLRQEHVITLETRPGQHRGQGPGLDPRPRPELPPHAARPHHRRRVSRRPRPWTCSRP